MQQINLFFLLLTLNMYLSVGLKIKSTKQRKCILSNRLVSLKHVHVTWVSQHDLINPQAINSDWSLTRRRFSWLKLLWGRGQGLDMRTGGRITQTPNIWAWNWTDPSKVCKYNKNIRKNGSNNIVFLEWKGHFIAFILWKIVSFNLC